VIIFFLSLGVFVIDQGLKFLFLHFFPSFISISFSTLVFSNKGAVIASIIFLTLLFGLFLRDKKIILADLWACLGLGFCFGGALSNLLDRLARGGVLDIGQTGFKTNLADILVLAGLFMLFYFYFSKREIEK